MTERSIKSLVKDLRGYLYPIADDDPPKAEWCAGASAVMHEAASALERLQKDYAMAEERCETWKAQAGRDQQENLVLKAQLHGAHCTAFNHSDLNEHESYPVPQLVQFLRELVRSCDVDGFVTPGKWRAKELSQCADRMAEMFESYLAVCEHEAALASAEQQKGKA